MKTTAEKYHLYIDDTGGVLADSLRYLFALDEEEEGGS